VVVDDLVQLLLKGCTIKAVSIVIIACRHLGWQH